MASYQRINLGTLRARLTERVGNNSTFWTDPEKNDAINEAIMIWQCMTGEFTKVFSIPAGGGNFVNVPRQVASTNRVSFNGTPLTLISLFELDMGYPGWPATLGTPYYWAPLGFNMIAISPLPTTGSLTFEGYSEVPRLGGDADFIQTSDNTINAMLSYAQHYLSFKEGGKELESTAPLMVAFVSAASARNKRLVASNLYRRYFGATRDDLERESTVDQASGVRA